MSPLSMAVPGEEVEVAFVRAGWGLTRRLADMGLVPGAKIKVMNSQMWGPVLVELKGYRLALGRGVAQRVLVKEV